MKISQVLVTLTFVAVISLPAISHMPDPSMLQPSEALRLMLWDAMHSPTASREDIYRDLLPRVNTDQVELDEQFFLGEIYFFALMPEEARDAYYPLRTGDSMMSRVAWQRLLQIRFRAFSMFDRVEREMTQFRKNFPPNPADREYLSTQVINFGRRYAAQGEHEKVVDAVEAELAVLDFRGAYRSLLLPATFYESYEKADRGELALERLRAARAGLSSTLEERGANPPEENVHYMLPARRYAFFFTPVTEKLGWEQQNDKFRELIADIDQAITQIESGQSR